MFNYNKSMAMNFLNTWKTNFITMYGLQKIHTMGFITFNEDIRDSNMLAVITNYMKHATHNVIYLIIILSQL